METAGSVLQGNLPLETKLQRAREELLNLSARNRLLNVPRSSKSGWASRVGVGTATPLAHTPHSATARKHSKTSVLR